MTEGERLQKVLAHAGLGSRRSIEKLIAEGRVRVNGQRALLGRRIDPLNDQVQVDGARVPLDVRLVHYLLNKPEGVVTTAADPEGRPIVADLVDAPERVWPVGRLDVDTEGALVMTNDGELTFRLSHPSYEIPKTYLAEVRGALPPKAARALERGVDLADGRARASRAAILERLPGAALVEITVVEGRNRMVRRMFEAVGHPVRRLVRTGIGPLMLGRLKPGTVRRLSPHEVHDLYRAVGL